MSIPTKHFTTESLRGAIKINLRTNLGKIFSWGGGQKFPNFNLGIFETQEWGLDFSKMSEF